jgi:hypothetical protein
MAYSRVLNATLACVTCCASVGAHEAVCAEAIDVPLTAAPMNAGETGRAALIALGDRTQVTITVSGVPPQLASRPVHLYTYVYASTCGSGGAQPAFALTGRVLADSPSGASGRGPFTLTNVAPVSVESLTRGGSSIRVLTSPADGGREIFCGDIHLKRSVSAPRGS